MKSGQVLTDRRYKWFEPEYWRFGDPASAEGQINYMRHASGQVRSTLVEGLGCFLRVCTLLQLMVLFVRISSACQLCRQQGHVQK